jgi:hypothetical protein
MLTLLDLLLALLQISAGGSDAAKSLNLYELLTKDLFGAYAGQYPIEA